MTHNTPRDTTTHARRTWRPRRPDAAGLGRPHPPAALTLGGLPGSWPWSTTGRRYG